MTDFSEQFNKYFNFASFQPARDLYGASADTMDKLARQNYQLLGDVMDYALQQMKLPVDTANANEYASRQIDMNRALGQKMTERFMAYVEIARHAQARATDSVAAEIKQVA